MTIGEMVAATGFDVIKANSVRNSMTAFAAASPAMTAFQDHLTKTDPFWNLSPEYKDRLLGIGILNAAKMAAFDRLAGTVATGNLLNSSDMKTLERFARSPEADRLAKFASSPEGQRLADMAKLGMPRWLKGEC